VVGQCFFCDIYAMFVYEISFWKIIFFKFFFVCLILEKLGNEKYFLVKEKFSLVFRKVFS
jgi:hypothetical protein